MTKSTTGRYTAGDPGYYKISAEVELPACTTIERNAEEGDQTQPGPNTRYHQRLLAAETDLHALSQQNSTQDHQSSNQLAMPRNIEYC